MDDFESACVTGGAGFIGSHLTDRLIDDTDVSVTVFDDLSSGCREQVPTDATFIEADIRNTERLRSVVESVDVVFHQAARVSVRRSIEAPVDSHGHNLDPIVSILEAAREGNTRVVFASSAAIYGDPEYTPIDESHPKAPNSPYGLEKLTADHYCRLYHDLYGVETVSLRYFNVYGPRQRAGDYAGVIAVFHRQAGNDDPITVDGDGTQTRDFVHVDDVVRANLLAATTDDAAGLAFNVGTGTQISIRTLAETIREVTGSDSDIVHTDPRPGDIDESVANIDRAREVLGYEPQYDVFEGIAVYLGE